MSIRIEARNGHLVIDIRTRGPDGEPIRERRYAPGSINTEKAAMKWADARRRHIETHGKPKPQVAVPTLAEFGARWMQEYCVANGHKPSTIYAREIIMRRHLYPVLGSVRLDRIGEMQAQKVKLAMVGLSDKTIACVLGTLATVLHTAQTWGLIEKAPHIRQPRPKQGAKEFYDFEDWERLIAGAAKAGPMVLCMVLLGGEAGLRRGEMVALEQGDIGSDAILVRRNEWNGGKRGGIHVGTPKSGKERRLPMTARLRAAVAAVRHLRGDRLLWQESGEPVRFHTLRSWMLRATRLGGLPASSDIHRLRHTFCSHLALLGVPVTTIQKLAGHSSLTTTSGYMHIVPGSMDAAIRVLEEPTGSRIDVRGILQRAKRQSDIL